MTPKIITEARKAAKIVKTWPLWKQNLLMNSLNPTTEPRELRTSKPVNAELLALANRFPAPQEWYDE